MSHVYFISNLTKWWGGDLSEHLHTQNTSQSLHFSIAGRQPTNDSIDEASLPVGVVGQAALVVVKCGVQEGNGLVWKREGYRK